eukprot:EG_transcript_10130
MLLFYLRHRSQVCRVVVFAFCVLFFLLVVLDIALNRSHHTSQRTRGIFDPAVADLVNLTGPEGPAAAFRWKAPYLYPAAGFRVEFRRTACNGIAAAGGPQHVTGVDDSEITDVFCGDVFSAHWGHFAEYLFPCWSFFQQHPDAHWYLLTAPVHSPGIDGYQLEPGALKFADRLRHLRVDLVTRVPEKACSVYKLVQKLPPRRDGLRSREGVLSFVNRSDAARLRNTLLLAAQKVQPGDLARSWGLAKAEAALHGILSLVTEDPFATGLRVAFLHRQGSRALSGLPALKQLWAHRYPAHRLSEMTDISALPFLQQCQWVHRQHIIVGPHGAQLTNLICGAPCTVFLELWPRRYFLPGWFPPLAVHLDMVAYGLYPYAPNPYADSEPCFRVPLCREFAKAQLVPASPLILELLPHMLRSRAQCCAKLNLPDCPV